MQKFPKVERLVRRCDYEEVKRRGVRVRQGAMVIVHKSGQAKRLGIVVSRHVGIASERNRIKRVIREYFRCNKETFPDGDCVFIPSSGVVELTNEKIRELIAAGLKKILK